MSTEAANANHCILNTFAEYILQPHEASVTRSCLHKAYEHSTEPDADLLSRHIYSTGWVGAAWTSSFFDTITFTGKALSAFSFALIQLDYNEIGAHLSGEGREVISAALRIFILPFCLFAGLFIPESIYGKFNYPPQARLRETEADSALQALVAGVREANRQLEQALNENQDQRARIIRLEEDLESARNASAPPPEPDLLGEALDQNNTLQERITQLERDLQTARATQSPPQPHQNELQQALDQNGQLQATIRQLQTDLQTAQQNTSENARLQQQIEFLSGSNESYINSILSAHEEKNRAVQEKAALNAQLDKIINTVTPMRTKANMQVFEERWKALEADRVAELKTKLSYPDLLIQSPDIRWDKVKNIYASNALVGHSIRKIEENNPLFE